MNGNRGKCEEGIAAADLEKVGRRRTRRCGGRLISPVRQMEECFEEKKGEERKPGLINWNCSWPTYSAKLYCLSNSPFSFADDCNCGGSCAHLAFLRISTS